ncbi:hypothetical protein NDR89_19620 [Cupriavidus gilardii]|uniref:Terminase small subunit protein n=1 Tax=Cupriavidus gilardii TaxID=82541 RepID=A0ABY4VU15_9BURK|nr:hypothetical protein [Cupriavidus gilardii]USE78848.1 hypothetical protein NDR89_19620 [Cupriavidus gilardii]
MKSPLAPTASSPSHPLGFFISTPTMSNETPNLRSEDGSWDRAAVMAIVCERIAGGESVRKICEDADMPDRRLINRWIAADECLRKQYLDACRARTYFYGEEIVDIADTCRTGIKTVVKETANGTFTETTEIDLVERARLQIDTRKWVMARMNRVDFGEKVTQEHVGKDGGPIEQKTTVVDEREVRDIVDRIEGEY